MLTVPAGEAAEGAGDGCLGSGRMAVMASVVVLWLGGAGQCVGGLGCVGELLAWRHKVRVSEPRDVVEAMYCANDSGLTGGDGSSGESHARLQVDNDDVCRRH